MSTMHNTLRGGLLAAAALLAAGPARAAEPSPGYAGANWGARANVEIDCFSGGDCARNAGNSGKLYAGYALDGMNVFGLDTSNALELAVFSVGEVSGGVPVRGVAMQGRGKASGITLNKASAIYFNRALAFSTRLGVSYAHATADLASAPGLRDYGAGGHAAHNRFGVTAGFGLAYAITRDWSLHADYDYLPISFASDGNSHVNLYSLGAAYHF